MLKKLARLIVNCMKQDKKEFRVKINWCVALLLQTDSIQPSGVLWMCRNTLTKSIVKWHTHSQIPNKRVEQELNWPKNWVGYSERGWEERKKRTIRVACETWSSDKLIDKFLIIVWLAFFVWFCCYSRILDCVNHSQNRATTTTTTTAKKLKHISQFMHVS